MTLLAQIVSKIDAFTDILGRGIAWFTFVMVLISFTIVFLRYGLNIGSVAMQESVLYFHGLVFMLGAGYTLQKDGHVRVDIFYQRFSKRTKALVDLFGGLFLLLPVCVFVFFASFDYVIVSWRILESSPEAGGLPLVYINKSFLLLFAVTLSLQGVAEILRNILIIKNEPELLAQKESNGLGESS